MTYPVGATFGTVQYTGGRTVPDGPDVDLLPDFEPFSGYVRIVPQPNTVTLDGGLELQPGPYSFTLDAAGVMRDPLGRSIIPIVACDAAGMSPNGWTYTAQFVLDNGIVLAAKTFRMLTGQAVDLASWVSIATSMGVAIARGRDGVTPALGIGTVTTGAAGTAATVSLVNTAAGGYDLNFTIPAGSAIADGDKGDISVTGGGTAWTVDNGAITLAKLADVATLTMRGRLSAGTGPPQDLTAAQSRTAIDVYSTGTADAALATKASITHAATHAPAGSDDLTTALSAVAVPVALGTAAVGAGTGFARQGHVHPTTGVGLVANPLSQFAATTSLQLKGVLSDETGSGAAVFATSPALVTPTGIVKGDVGLGNVDNTADTAKPVSTAGQAALDLKANLTGVDTLLFKAADESRQSVTTTAVDGTLFFSGAINSEYVIDGMLWMDSAAAADFKMGVYGPAGVTGYMRAVGGLTSIASANYTGTVGNQTLGVDATVGSVAVGTIIGVPFQAYVKTAGTAGNIELRWAQNTSTASNTTVRQGSTMRYRKVA